MGIFKKKLSVSRSSQFKRNVISISSIDSLKAYFGWNKPAKFFPEDFNPTPLALHHINNRRLLDALVIATASANCPDGDAIEIGTSMGRTTALIADNINEGRFVHTLDILPNQFNGGTLITHTLTEGDIGSYYKARNYSNIVQHFGDSMRWEVPAIKCGVSFIDGCHDYNYILNDTRKIYPRVVSGGYMMWHDFNPDLVDVFDWLNPVCDAIDTIVSNGEVALPILYVRDSFVAICRKP